MLIKQKIDMLKLNKYYNSFYRDDNSVNYMVYIYMYKVTCNGEEIIYIGNKQIPTYMDNDYTKDKYNVANFWLYGMNDNYRILHIFPYTSNGYTNYNGVYNKLGNQKLLNIIKKEVINILLPNFNVRLCPDDFDIQEQFGIQISNYKNIISKSLREYTIDEFRNDLIYILTEIDRNRHYWHKFTIVKNRFWFISNFENDIKEREFIHFDDFTLHQQSLIILLKEWIGKMINDEYCNPRNKMSIQNIIYKLNNTHFKNEELFLKCKSKFFCVRTSIMIILSVLYNTTSEYHIATTYKSFMNWRDNYCTKIFSNK